MYRWCTLTVFYYWVPLDIGKYTDTISFGFHCAWLHWHASCALYKTTPCHTQAVQCEWDIEPCLRLCTWGSNEKLTHSKLTFMSKREVKGQRTEIRRKRRTPLPLDPGCRAAPLPHPHRCLTDILPTCPLVLVLCRAALLPHLCLLICISVALALVFFLLVFLLPAALQKSPMWTVPCGIVITAAWPTLHL